MMALSNFRWALIALVAAMYVVMCVRVAGRMAKIGRSGVAWFFISFFCTAIPAARVLRRHYRHARAADQSASRDVRRCEHCGAVLGDDAGPPGQAVCPQCDMKLNEETLA